MTTAARLAFHGFTEPETAPSPAATRARVDAACATPDRSQRRGPKPLPEARHRLFWRFPVEDGREIRVTTARGSLFARLWVWNPRTESWWPLKGAHGIRVDAADVEGFASAVAEAAKDVRRNGWRARGPF